MAQASFVEDKETTSDSIAFSRSRRERKDKGNRLSTLEKLRKAKASGEKLKYELKDENRVYDEVDEDEYSEVVRRRQEDDWIIDDDGTGYIEDGREIFDDDLDEKVANRNKAKKSDIPGNKRVSKNAVVKKTEVKSSNIKSMFMASAVKKKTEADVKLSEDEILGNLMQELQSNIMTPSPPVFSSGSRKKPKLQAEFNRSNQMSTFKSPVNTYSVQTPKRSKLKKLIPRTMDYENTATILSPKASRQVRAPSPQFQEQFEDFQEQVEDIPNIEDCDSQKADEVNIKNIIEDNADFNDVDFENEFNIEDASQVEVNFKETKVDAKPAEVKMEIDDLTFNSAQPSFIASMSQDNDVSEAVTVDISGLPLTITEDGENVLRFYWIDAYEDYFKHPGVVYLFGKVFIDSAKTDVSCCVAVKNIERRIYLLPREFRKNMKTGEISEEPVSLKDVYDEFDKIAETYKILQFKSRVVKKSYAFEIADIPVESQYLEVRYSACLQALPNSLCGETFSHVFGTNTSSLEILLVDRKIKGPNWLDIKCPQLPSPPVSWCKVEASINKIEYISVVKGLPPPPMIVLTLVTRTVINPKNQQNEIVGFFCLWHRKFYLDKSAPKPPFQQYFCAITNPVDSIFPFDFKDKIQKQNKIKVDAMGSERALLGFVLAKILKIDPDVIVGHDIFGFDLPVILHRISVNKIPHWSRLGRLRRNEMPKLMGSNKTSVNLYGRLLCDVKISSKELIRSKSYDLTELCSCLFKEQRQDLGPDIVKQMFNSSDHLMHLIDLSLRDATLILQILCHLNVLPLALQITNIAGNVMSRTLLGGRSERNEYLLLHAFHEKDFICPDKEFKKKSTQIDIEFDEEGNSSTVNKKGKRKPAYAGGLVLEPKKGFYDKYILLLDFNSLYPSIIQEYNICFTTVSRSVLTKDKQTEEEEDMNVELPDSDLEQGILPKEIKKLVESRRQVKQLLNTPDLSFDLKLKYDIRQKALKLTANSMYGCLGFSHSRFYAKALASLITSKGREILLQTKELVQKMNLDVIYGDTDSLMINTNCTEFDQVTKLGVKVKNEVNKLYRHLELDIDGIFKCLLLLKKKKYAALSIKKMADGTFKEEKELKGLDIVRRDWCDLAKDVGNYVIEQILSAKQREEMIENIHSHLREISDLAKQDGILLKKFTIVKQLTRNPEDYPDKKHLPHVNVALRMNTKDSKKLRQGDAVYYVICQDGSNLPATQRAYHLDEMKQNEQLKIDLKYYLSQQIHPVVARLCDCIDGTNASCIAENLGLDPSGYKTSSHHHAEDDDDALLGGMSQLDDEERFKDCQRLKVNCPNCQQERIFESLFIKNGSALQCSLDKCNNNECGVIFGDYTAMIANRMTLAAREHIKLYYSNWLTCEDRACGNLTRKLPVNFNRSYPVCDFCDRGSLHSKYSEAELYTQLCFYQHLVDIDKAINNVSKEDQIQAKVIKDQHQSSYNRLKRNLERILKQNAYSEVNLTKLFECLMNKVNDKTQPMKIKEESSS